MVIDIILYSSFISTFLLIWFQTNVVFEYFRFLPFFKSICNKYKKSLEAGIGTNFINFIALNYNSFLVRLITCPYCITFWLCLPVCCIFNWKYFGLIYILSMLYFKLVVLISK